MQRRPTVGPGSQKAPFRERLPGTISKLGKGTALQRWQSMGIAKVASMSSWVWQVLGAEGRCSGGWEWLGEMGGWSFSSSLAQAPADSLLRSVTRHEFFSIRDGLYWLTRSIVPLGRCELVGF